MIEDREARDAKKEAVDLSWLAYLLTGRRDISIDFAGDTAVATDDADSFFATWMRTWSRRIAIAKVLAPIHAELAASARRTDLAKAPVSAPPPREWSPSPDTTKRQIEEALLAIEVFPRAALLLLVFEGVRITDAAALLDSDAALVRKAQAIGARELASNLAPKDGLQRPGASVDSGMSLATVRD